MAVCVDGKWGYVDREGNEVIAPEYDSSWTFTNVVTGTERNYCYAASDGFIPLTKDGKVGAQDCGRGDYGHSGRNF